MCRKFFVYVFVSLLFGSSFSHPADGAEDASGKTAELLTPGPRTAELRTLVNTQSAKTPLVTGNGFGFAVLSLRGAITKLYAHPYRFERPNPDVSKDGVSTANLVRLLVPVVEGASPSVAQVDYVKESNVISAKSAAVERFYFMPFGLKHNALVVVQPPSEAHTLAWDHRVKDVEKLNLFGRDVKVTSFFDVSERVAFVPLEKQLVSERTHDGEIRLPGSGWALMVLEANEPVEKTIFDLIHWQNDLASAKLVEREVEEMEAWRVKPSIRFFTSAMEGKVWRQNETILRMSQIREENRDGRYNHGLILASLPDGVWFTPWVRDMSYAVVALAQMGHQAEARDAILSWFNARPVGKWRHETRNADYQISVVRYFGDGSEEADYSGWQTPNVEFDDWGLTLWVVSEYVRDTKDVGILSVPTYRGTIYESMRDYVVRPLLVNLDPYEDGLIVAEDSSLWEEHQQHKMHYASATITAIQGLRAFQALARTMKDDATLNMVADKLKLLEIGFNKAFVHDGVLRGSVESSFKNEIDGALVEALNYDLVREPNVIKRTLEKMELLKTASGGYRRVRGDSEYEAHEFLFINFNLARFYFKSGIYAKGQDLLNRMVEKSCQDHCLIPEMYVSKMSKDYPGEIGAPAGSTPMVGYGAGDFVMTLVERERAANQKEHSQRQK